MKSQSGNPRQDMDLQQFMLDLLASQGALVDVPEYALVEALLPTEAAATLDMPSEIKMAFDYDTAQENPGAHFITFGHPLLDGAVQLGKTLGKVTQKLAVVDRLSVPPGMLDWVEKKLQFVRCKKPSLRSSAMEEAVWLNEYRDFHEAQEDIRRFIRRYNEERPVHRGELPPAQGLIRFERATRTIGLSNHNSAD